MFCPPDFRFHDDPMARQSSSEVQGAVRIRPEKCLLWPSVEQGGEIVWGANITGWGGHGQENERDLKAAWFGRSFVPF